MADTLDRNFIPMAYKGGKVLWRPLPESRPLLTGSTGTVTCGGLVSLNTRRERAHRWRHVTLSFLEKPVEWMSQFPVRLLGCPPGRREGHAFPNSSPPPPVSGRFLPPGGHVLVPRTTRGPGWWDV